MLPLGPWLAVEPTPGRLSRLPSPTQDHTPCHSSQIIWSRDPSCPVDLGVGSARGASWGAGGSYLLWVVLLSIAPWVLHQLSIQVSGFRNKLHQPSHLLP